MQAGEERAGGPRPRLEEERAELVAAQASDGVGLARGSAERRGERAQEPVALRVPLAVVRLLEAVEVEEDERDAPAVAPRPRDLGERAGRGTPRGSGRR